MQVFANCVKIELIKIELRCAELLTINANAKINLTLDILDKREDGYHDVPAMYCFLLNFPLAFFRQCCIIDVKKRPALQSVDTVTNDFSPVGFLESRI